MMADANEPAAAPSPARSSRWSSFGSAWSSVVSSTVEASKVISAKTVEASKKLAVATQDASEKFAASSAGKVITEGVSKLGEHAERATKNAGVVVGDLHRRATDSLGLKHKFADDELQKMYDCIINIEGALDGVVKSASGFEKDLGALSKTAHELTTVMMDFCGKSGRGSALNRDVMGYRMRMNDLTQKDIAFTTRGQWQAQLQSRVFDVVTAAKTELAALKSRLSMFETQTKECAAIARGVAAIEKKLKEAGADKPDAPDGAEEEYFPEPIVKLRTARKAKSADLDTHRAALERTRESLIEDLQAVHKKRDDMVMAPYNGLKWCQCQFLLSAGDLIADSVDERPPLLKPVINAASSPVPPGGEEGGDAAAAEAKDDGAADGGAEADGLPATSQL